MLNSYRSATIVERNSLKQTLTNTSGHDASRISETPTLISQHFTLHLCFSEYVLPRTINKTTITFVRAASRLDFFPFPASEFTLLSLVAHHTRRKLLQQK